MSNTKSIAIVWTIEDVQQERQELTDEQSGDVLDLMYRKHDANLGISYETIFYTAESLFPVSEEIT